jgi:hypothetical protein
MWVGGLVGVYARVYVGWWVGTRVGECQRVGDGCDAVQFCSQLKDSMLQSDDGVAA